MPALDYNAIMTPGGAASGFADLASTIAKIPQIRREQALKQLQMQMEQRRLDNQDRYWQAMGGARQTQAGAAMQRAEDAHALVQPKIEDTESKVKTREAGEQARAGHWQSQDQTAEGRLELGKIASGQHQQALGLKAATLIPTTAHTPVVNTPFNGPKTAVVDTGVTPQQRLAQGQSLLLQAGGGAKYGQAMAGGGPQLAQTGPPDIDPGIRMGQPPTAGAPAAPAAPKGVVTRSALRTKVKGPTNPAGMFADEASAETAAKQLGYTIVEDQ